MDTNQPSPPIQSFVDNRGMRVFLPIMYALALLVSGILYVMETYISGFGEECIEVVQWCMHISQLFFTLESFPGAIIMHLIQIDIQSPMGMIGMAVLTALFYYAFGNYIDRSRVKQLTK